ncbi:2,4-dichlorophenoxyacetate alpha-ketoglutarate dioxygenase [Trichoderma reesei RUT C-30]|uniref:2,4-dichlorophenoxyacetate alpha-ketoglutarate dioxygenase n=1 Tax=Hypocrea jecorina (strain ATCC 56765 / BCRC 32924 / NRRL 11460 / Rut C-30) TaxID=1344414 RepID=A0A024SE38_HYPJR|nr:2,4-dichlorophenoxyacetate alpha-ketoglutarate dioxygenase [Trichoderma reesei RUT C-30]
MIATIDLSKITEISPGFGAEICGFNATTDITEENFRRLQEAVTTHGVVVIRDSQLSDESHIRLARMFGELDDVKPYISAGRKNRLRYDELFDGNSLFHVDSSFNPRRAAYSLLLAHELPPEGTGGKTAFADTRTSFDDLDEETKQDLLANDYVAAHSMLHSRKLAAPEYFADLDPCQFPMGRHKIVQRHEKSGRMNLYIAAHIHHIEKVSKERSAILLEKIFKHATQPKYVIEVEWKQPGDLVIWDNTCTMHRVVSGPYSAKYRRDMRRATVHDSSTTAWGLNEHSNVRQGLP